MGVAIRSEAEFEAAQASASKVVQTHERLSEFLRHGQTLAQIDAFVAKTLADLKCRSCFLGYKAGRSPPFPSHACLSLNHCVVHGTAGYHTAPLKAGDLLKIDIGVTFQGWIGDAAWTYSFGEPGEVARRLMECGKESLRRGVAQLRPGKIWLDYARAVQDYVEGECDFHLIRGLGGHGYGRRLHEEPYISNVVPGAWGEWKEAKDQVLAGSLVAVEPMIAAGTSRMKHHASEWPIYTADGSLSVHYEHDVAITAEGPRVLTAGLEKVNDIVTA